jgi:hypothetical protein
MCGTAMVIEWAKAKGSGRRDDVGRGRNSFGRSSGCFSKLIKTKHMQSN